jgi:hypothetical protein
MKRGGLKKERGDNEREGGLRKREGVNKERCDKE